MDLLSENSIEQNNQQHETSSVLLQQSVAGSNDDGCSDVQRATPKQFVCKDCGKTFKSRSGFVAHQRIHTGEKPFKCSARGCSKSFRTQSDRARHLRTHTGMKTHQCTVVGCGVTFSTSTNLTTHKKVVHEGIKQFVCGTCNKSFGYLTNYRNHVRIHTGETPYTCSYPGCSMQFTEYSIALRHTLHAHAVQGTFRCAKCPRIFRSRGGLEYHVKILHGHDDSTKQIDMDGNVVDTSFLRDLIMQELPQCVSFTPLDGADFSNVLDHEREAAILLGFYDEDQEEEFRPMTTADEPPVQNLVHFCEDSSREWSFYSGQGRESFELFPELLIHDV